MQLERVGAVLEVVLRADHLARQLAQFAHRHEASIELVRDRRREDEPARLHPDDHPRHMRSHQVRELINRLLEGSRILQERGDVLEQNPLFGEIRYVAYQWCEFQHGDWPLL